MSVERKFHLPHYTALNTPALQHAAPGLEASFLRLVEWQSLIYPSSATTDGDGPAVRRAGNLFQGAQIYQQRKELLLSIARYLTGSDRDLRNHRLILTLP